MLMKDRVALRRAGVMASPSARIPMLATSCGADGSGEGDEGEDGSGRSLERSRRQHAEPLHSPRWSDHFSRIDEQTGGRGAVFEI